MTLTNDNTIASRVLAEVTRMPGITALQLRDHLHDCHPKRIAQACRRQVKVGCLHVAGTAHRIHYYLTAEAAAAAQPGLLAEYERHRVERKHRQNTAAHAARSARRRKAQPKPPMYAALDATIIEAAACNDGFASGIVRIGERQFTSTLVGSRCHKLVIDGRLHRGKLSHRKVRFFSTQAAADAWVYANRASVAPVVVKSAAAFVNRPAIIPPHVKVQRIKHGPGRYSVDLKPGRGQITADWMMTRQGIDVRTVLALAELVALRDLKDRIEAADLSTYDLADAEAAQALADDYQRRKPKAWDAARAVLLGPNV